MASWTRRLIVVATLWSLTAAKRGGAKGGAGFGKPARTPAPRRPATSPTGTCFTPDERWRALKAWLADRGARVDGVDVGVVDEASGLRGVVSTRSFQRGDPVLVIPRTCILDDGRADGRLPAELHGLPPHVRIAVDLVVRRRERDWQPVCDMLPTMEDFAREGGPLLLWSEAEVAACGCALVAARHSSQQRRLLEAHELVTSVWAAHKDSPCPSLDEVTWAVATVTSRAYAGGKAGATSMLIPAVDLCNHADPKRVHTRKGLTTVGDKEAFVVVANEAIAPGAEVFLTYGALSSRQLLLQFGFVPQALPEGDAQGAMVRLDALYGNAADGQEGWWAAGLPEEARQRLQAAVEAGNLVQDPEFGAAALWQPCGAPLVRAVDDLQPPAVQAMATVPRSEAAVQATLALVDRELTQLRARSASGLVPPSSASTARARLADAFATRAEELLIQARSRMARSATAGPASGM